MLFIGFLGFVGNHSSGPYFLNPSHLPMFVNSGLRIPFGNQRAYFCLVVGLEGSIVNFAEPLLREGMNDSSEDEIRYCALYQIKLSTSMDA